MSTDDQIRLALESLACRIEYLRNALDRERIYVEDMGMPNIVPDRAQDLLKSAQLVAWLVELRHFSLEPAGGSGMPGTIRGAASRS